MYKLEVCRDNDKGLLECLIYSYDEYQTMCDAYWRFTGDPKVRLLVTL